MLKINVIVLPVTKERGHSYIPARASPEIMGETSIPSNILHAMGLSSKEEVEIYPSFHIDQSG